MELGILYCCIHKRASGHSDSFGLLSKKEFKSMLSKVYHVPKNLQIVIMKEMEHLKMIEDEGLRTNKFIKINPVENDPEENVSVIYRKFGFY